ncbi:unnamed protein product [Rotaria sordida]|uniref:Uncharacterized protein n=1 Tax=Rotaria sordida TaxID=392033 RepID=A0A819C7H6_9BILA|nr:unnamed protein product [Rotaria sordida]CAF1316999.1 unnamed protein product [Rotaria sordida]CAF1583496.1 unnamed protein product [Rotaria sordida]CAF3803214.1 unnamed protein product [Rotaria sordida]
MITNFDKAFEKVAEIRYRKKQHDAVKTYDISFYQIAFEFDRIIFSVTNKCPPLDKIFGEDAGLFKVLAKIRQQYANQMLGRKFKFLKNYGIKQRISDTT